MTGRARRVRPDTVSVSLIGAGAWARAAHLAALAARTDVRLDTVYDLDPRRARAVAHEYGFARVARDLDELLDADADACIVASPAAAHAQQTLGLLAAGTHVLLEKPMTNDAASARAIADAADDTGLTVLLALGWNYTPVFDAARRMLETHAIGDLEHVVLHMASGTHALLSGESADSSGRADHLAAPTTWIDPAVSGGGYGNAQASHALGVLFGLIDDRIVAGSAVARPGPYPGVELGFALAGRLESGATLAVSGTSVRSPARQRLDLRLYGSGGCLEVDMFADLVRWVGNDGEEIRADLPAGAGLYPGQAPAGAFLDIVRGLGAVNRSDARVGLRSTEVLDLLRTGASA